jgi:hypothetical protein
MPLRHAACETFYSVCTVHSTRKKVGLGPESGSYLCRTCYIHTCIILLKKQSTQKLHKCVYIDLTLSQNSLDE